MRVVAALAILGVLTGCAKGTRTHRDAVPPAAIAEFVQVLESGDHHGAVRKGTAVFERGRVVHDHEKVFGAYPAVDAGQGMIRYDLSTFQGEASVGVIYLFLEQSSGTIIRFMSYETIGPAADEPTGRLDRGEKEQKV